MKIRSGRLREGVALGLFLAGPTFLALLGFGYFIQQLPQAITVPDDLLTVTDLIAIPQVFALSAFFGAIISAPAQLPGAWCMAQLANVCAWARAPSAWIAVGTLMGIVIAFVFSWGSAPAAFALIGTSAICAWLCRRPLSWVEEANYVSPWARQF